MRSGSVTRVKQSYRWADMSQNLSGRGAPGPNRHLGFDTERPGRLDTKKVVIMGSSDKVPLKQKALWQVKWKNREGLCSEKACGEVNKKCKEIRM